MTRLNGLVLSGLVSASFYFASEASACSLVNLAQDELKAAMIPQIAKVAKVDASLIDPSTLTDVKLDFLVPLGGDCSGLYGAYHASAFNFTVDLYPTVRCNYTGLAIIMGYGLDKPVSVQLFRQCTIS
ncbi:MAG: hypothetical protein M3Q07_02965 [Pseudobdellovibrionaceae bacterium]|nr:hypothetical protein [Pseudobdellovibrionaceae bacterium]